MTETGEQLQVTDGVPTGKCVPGSCFNASLGVQLGTVSEVVTEPGTEPGDWALS